MLTGSLLLTLLLTIEQLPDVGAAEVHERGDVGDLVYEEELAARRPARPPGEHRLHEAHEADEVIIVRPERPQLMMGQGLTLRVLAGVVHADKHSWKRASVNKSAFRIRMQLLC